MFRHCLHCFVAVAVARRDGLSRIVAKPSATFALPGRWSGMRTKHPAPSLKPCMQLASKLLRATRYLSRLTLASFNTKIPRSSETTGPKPCKRKDQRKRGSPSLLQTALRISVSVCVFVQCAVQTTFQDTNDESNVSIYSVLLGGNIQAEQIQDLIT